MRCLFAIILAAACNLTVLAQAAPKAEIFAGYSYGNYELFSAPASVLSSINGTAIVSNTSNARLGLTGWNVSGAVSLNRWFSFATDFSGYYSASSASVHATETISPCPSCGTQIITSVDTFVRPQIHNFLFGPQVSHRSGNIRPFAQFLVGGEHAAGTRTTRIATTNGLLPLPAIVESAHIGETGFAMAFGGGLDFTLKRNLAWRVQADYLTSQAGLAQSHMRFSTGLIWRIRGGSAPVPSRP
jgi:hypothetical protein